MVHLAISIHCHSKGEIRPRNLLLLFPTFSGVDSL
jgi:hypothetical protein